MRTTRETIEVLFEQWKYIGLRLQRGSETKTKIGDALRASHVWVDGRKMKTALPGTAGFYFRDADGLDGTLEQAQNWGYHAEKGERWVLIGSNDGVTGAGNNIVDSFVGEGSK